jgi:membrane-associated protease RseP (regulator of RpoE activity)
MKTIPLLLTAILIAGPARGGPQSFDLGNGTVIKVDGNRVSVHSSSSDGGSVSSSTNSRTDSSGNTVATVTSERNGQRLTRTVTIGKDGSIAVSDPEHPDAAPETGQPGPAAPAWLGVHSIPLTEALRAQLDLPESGGIVLEFVAPEGPAASAGLAAHDILLKLDGTPIQGVEEFRRQLAGMKPGQQTVIHYLRKGRSGTTTATLGTRPTDAAPAADGQPGTQQQPGTGQRTVIVDGNGQTHVVEGSGHKDAFDLLLNDPNVPAEIKEQLRKARVQLEEAGAGKGSAKP